MVILALETATKSASVAVADDEEILGSQEMPRTARTAGWLAVGVGELLLRLGKTPSDIGLVALSIGPGSFTGLRIGVTFAKVFCYSSGAALVALDTLEVIASQANARGSGAASGRIHAILDAGRGELFCASFDGDAEGKLACYSPTEIVSRVDFLARLQPEDAVTGPAVGALRAGLPDTLQVIDETCWSPHATTVAQLGYRYYQQGQRDDIWKLLPKYYRKSYAEEKR